MEMWKKKSLTEKRITLQERGVEVEALQGSVWVMLEKVSDTEMKNDCKGKRSVSAECYRGHYQPC